MTDTTHTGLRARIEALEPTNIGYEYHDGFRDCRGAVLTLLDAPPAPQETAGEAVAWRVRLQSDDPEEWSLLPAGGGADYIDRKGYDCQPLYTHPTPAAATTDNAAMVEALRIPAPNGSSNLCPHQKGYNEAIGDVLNALASRPAEATSHPDDMAVDRFAVAMKAKMAAARAKGRRGWDDPEDCTDEFLATLLIGHLPKGNPGNFEDIANLAMMLHQRGADPAILRPAEATSRERVEAGTIRPRFALGQKVSVSTSCEYHPEYRDMELTIIEIELQPDQVTYTYTTAERVSRRGGWECPTDGWPEADLTPALTPKASDEGAKS